MEVEDAGSRQPALGPPLAGRSLSEGDAPLDRRSDECARQELGRVVKRLPMECHPTKKASNTGMKMSVASSRVRTEDQMNKNRWDLNEREISIRGGKASIRYRRHSAVALNPDSRTGGEGTAAGGDEMT